MSQTLEENISEKTLEQARVNVGGVEEQKGEGSEDEGSEAEGSEGSEEQDQFHVEVVNNFFKNGVETVKTKAAQKRVILEYFNDTFNLKQNPALKIKKK